MAEMGVALGLAVGLILGLTGAGGSVVAVPLLMFGFGWSLTQAAPVALLAVFAAAAFGTLAAWDTAYIRYRAAMLMSASGLFTAPLGLQVASQMPGDLLTLAFAGILLIVATRMILQARKRPQETAVVRAAVAGNGTAEGGPLCRLSPLTGRIVWTKPCAVLIAMIGAGSGLLSGLFGVGGGFVIVPALRMATPLSIHSAIATSLLSISLTSAITLLSAILMGRHIDTSSALPFVVGGLAGMYAGRLLAPRIAGATLQQSFAVTMFLLAGLMAWRATQ